MDNNTPTLIVGQIGFTRPRDSKRFLLVGSHTSTVEVGHNPSKQDDCTGCGNLRARPIT